MAGRLGRFLRLEQPKSGGGAPHELATAARFREEPSGIALAGPSAQVTKRASESARPLTPEAQRLLGEAIAREVGERERARLSWWGSESMRDATPAGIRLLSMLPTRRARVMVAAVALAAFAAGALAALDGSHRPALRGAGLLISLLLLVLFAPNLPRRRRGGPS